VRGADCELHPHSARAQAWDAYGALSNFAPFPVKIDNNAGEEEEWPTIEHFYQAQKFSGVEGAEDIAQVRAAREAIREETRGLRNASAMELRVPIQL